MNIDMESSESILTDQDWEAMVAAFTWDVEQPCCADLLYHYYSSRSVKRVIKKDGIYLRLAAAATFPDKMEGKAVEVFYDLALDELRSEKRITARQYEDFSKISVPEKLFLAKGKENGMIVWGDAEYEEYIICFSTEENDPYMFDNYIKDADGYCLHFFGLSIYYDLCADSDEKEKIKNALCAVTDHIISNNYRLIDRDGLPTTWACWNPDALNHDERWFSERGINSLEFLGILKVSHHSSGESRYNDLYREFISKYHYPLNVIRHKVRDAHNCHIDDNLGFLASLTYLRLEENDAVRSIVLCGLEDHWEYERPERQPMFSIIHAAMTGRDSDIADGIQSLREMPLDLMHYKMENSKRNDIEWDEEESGRHGRPQIKYALPYDESNVHRPDCGSFHSDSRGGGIQEPTVYLLPYWIGRYYGIISND